MPHVDVCLACICEIMWIYYQWWIYLSPTRHASAPPLPSHDNMLHQHAQPASKNGCFHWKRKNGGYLGNSWCSVPMQKFVPTSQRPTRCFSSGACFQEKHHTFFNLRRASQLDRKNLRTFLQAADRPKHRITHRYILSIVQIWSYIRYIQSVRTICLC